MRSSHVTGGVDTLGATKRHLVVFASSLHHFLSSLNGGFFFPEFQTMSSSVQSIRGDNAAAVDNSRITVTVADTEMWKHYDAVGNEMVLASCGRNPFPKFNLKIENLNPNENYKVALSFERVDDQRYTFNADRMESCGDGEPEQPSEKIFLPDAINSGAHLMQNGVKFDKIKVSNSLSDPSKPCVKLHLMHKYHAVAHIYRIEGYNPVLAPHNQDVGTLIASVAIPHTTFVTVSSYQNVGIVWLKVKYNNYARGFRQGEIVQN